MSEPSSDRVRLFASLAIATVLATGLALAVNSLLVPRAVERASRTLPLEALARRLPSPPEGEPPSSSDRSLKPLVLQKTAPQETPPPRDQPDFPSSAEHASPPSPAPDSSTSNRTKSHGSAPSTEVDPAQPPPSTETNPPEPERESQPAPPEPSADSRPSREGETHGDSRSNGDSRADDSPSVSAFHLDRGEINERLKHPDVIRRKIEVRSARNGVLIRKLEGEYGRLGLKPGDRVVAINGRDIESRRHAIARLLAMKNRRVFRLEVERNREVRTVRYVVE